MRGMISICVASTMLLALFSPLSANGHPRDDRRFFDPVASDRTEDPDAEIEELLGDETTGEGGGAGGDNGDAGVAVDGPGNAAVRGGEVGQPGWRGTAAAGG